jgi:hypothetical protein
MDLRQNKRYELTASVKFSWERLDGSTIRSHGYTKNISASSVFVTTAEQLAKGTVVELEINLPSLKARDKAGPCLQTVGHVVRSEAAGFAAVADIAFRMEIPETNMSQWSLGKSDGSEKEEALAMGARAVDARLRFPM